MLKLKDYQDKALTELITFLHRTRIVGVEAAWRESMVKLDRSSMAYQHRAFGDVSCVCLRIPTGGGKTVLAAHAIAQAGKALNDTDSPVALWLTPSDAIRSQTLEALNNPRHAYRQALETYFPQRVRVCDLEQLATINPLDVGRQAIVIVTTIQSFRIEDTSQRNVYAFDESLARHFQGLMAWQEEGLEKVTEADLQNQTYLTTADLGRVKTSLANWLYLQKPIVIVDEAHNNRTEKSFITLKRLNPSGVIELTATPIKGSNVLYHVSAQALKAEEMIKLPIVLAEHPTGWKDAVRDAILTRKHLETLAQRETEYIRPIVLFQAQAKGGEVTVEVLRKHLISEEGENIDKNEIAVATGSQKGLDGIDLFDKTCRVRYVITVEALKEGWDCSFAYVLCSLQESRSAKDVEQLLGRVLRMPYAKARSQPELNKAYAHVLAASFSEAADQITDKLVNNMGFERYEAAMAIQPVQQDLLDVDNGDSSPLPLVPDFVMTAPTAPALPIPEALQEHIEVRPTTNGVTVIVRGEMTEQAEEFLLSAYVGKHQPRIKEQIELHHIQRAALLAPSAKGIAFAPLPQLCFEFEGEAQLLERETLADLGCFDLLTQPARLDGFSVHESTHAFTIDVEGEKVTLGFLESRQLHLNDIPTEATEQDFVSWLDKQVRQRDTHQGTLIKYLTALLGHLTRDRRLSLTALIRGKFQLVTAICKEIERLRYVAIKRGFQQALPGIHAASSDDGFRYAFTFLPARYPAKHPFYSGRFKFKKHYYPMIHDLRERKADGKPAEEFICAQAIDTNPNVKHWVRNVEREEKLSFWFPTSTDYFYPDFVCELFDGRLLSVEYKGEPYKTNDDSREKMQIGHQWEKSSKGKCLFLMAVAMDEKGRDVRKQIEDKILGE